VARARIAHTRELDRFEREQLSFFERVRAGYLDRARQSPARVQVIDASQTLEAIQCELASFLDRL
jgi:dTMP kinase